MNAKEIVPGLQFCNSAKSTSSKIPSQKNKQVAVLKAEHE
jgi:hypothetical protein